MATEQGVSFDTRSADSPSSLQSDDGGSSRGKKRIRLDTVEDIEGPQKMVKRRAARACVSCRARKVRCDVVENSPCGNCRWDGVECIIQESRRRKKQLSSANAEKKTRLEGPSTECHLHRHEPVPITSAAELIRPSSDRGEFDISSASPSPSPTNFVASEEATVDVVPEGNSYATQLIYQRSDLLPTKNAQQLPQLAPIPLNSSDCVSPSQSRPHIHAQWLNPSENEQQNQFGLDKTSYFLSSFEEPNLSVQLPPFVRPLPSKIAAEDVKYLHIKGALTLPPIPLQNTLLQTYVEYVHPYMPLMDLHEFLASINCRDGLTGQISLLLYQAVMFSATAFVDTKHLYEAGYASRRAARKAFFLKTRLLYDFDYEPDRLVLVQALLLMSYWYETPDDQKDTWHWMGVAVSLAHTIGLHRDPGATSMAPAKQKLRRRIWWSCFMRDRHIALGMRRPLRIKDEDFDVPLLEENDFEIQSLADDINIISSSCTIIRDIGMQRELAALCIHSAKLCICISHMLKVQYSVLIRDTMKPENTTNSTMMLFPNKQFDNLESVNSVDMELLSWAESLPPSCQFRTLTPHDIVDGRSSLAVHRHLLHMTYYTIISALHRPQFLPPSPAPEPTTSSQVQEMSRIRVRDAAMHITRMATELSQLGLERYLPTMGVTVILPAMIIHLLEMKSPNIEARDRATRGFCHCMRVMERLRKVYAAADYATAFLDAALRRAGIDIKANVAPSTVTVVKALNVQYSTQTPPPDNVPYMTTSEGMFAEKPNIEPGQTLLPSDTVNVVDLNLPIAPIGANTPPHMGFGEDVTPMSAGSEDPSPNVEFDVMQGHDEFDWNAVTGADFDVDQWLQFPQDTVGQTYDFDGQWS